MSRKQLLEHGGIVENGEIFFPQAEIERIADRPWLDGQNALLRRPPTEQADLHVGVQVGQGADIRDPFRTEISFGRAGALRCRARPVSLAVAVQAVEGEAAFEIGAVVVLDVPRRRQVGELIMGQKEIARSLDQGVSQAVLLQKSFEIGDHCTVPSPRVRYSEPWGFSGKPPGFGVPHPGAWKFTLPHSTTRPRAHAGIVLLHALGHRSHAEPRKGAN